MTAVARTMLAGDRGTYPAVLLRLPFASFLITD
jgi:hypothetical protein